VINIPKPKNKPITQYSGFMAEKIRMQELHKRLTQAKIEHYFKHGKVHIKRRDYQRAIKIARRLEITPAEIVAE